MKFSNVHSVRRSSRFALRLAFFSLLCLTMFAALGGLRTGRVATAAPAAPLARTTAATQQKRTPGKTEAGRAKVATARRQSEQSAQKGGAKAAATSGDVRRSAVCAQNQPIAFGQTVNGTLTTGDCDNPIPLENGGDDTSLVDEYTFNGTPGQQITISMSSTQFDTVLYLLNPSGSVIAFNDDIDTSTNPPNRNSRIVFTLTESGVHSILANAFAPEDRGAYTLSLELTGTCTSTSINYNETKTGTLAAGDCTNEIEGDGTLVDLYTFSGTAGQQISITMTATSGNLNPYLYLLLPSGELLGDDDNGGGGTAARLPQTTGFGRLPATGTYTIVANTLETDQTGNYSLTLTRATTDCPSTALTLGTTVNGALATSDCRLLEDSSFLDVYTFNGTAGQQVSITMTATSGSLSPVLFLLSSTGNVLAIDINQDGDNTARIPGGTTTFPLPSNGSYTILANSFTTGQTGDYTLRVVDPAAPPVCTTTLAASGSNVGINGGGPLTVGVTIQPNCALTATSNASFIVNVSAINNNNGTGTVTYTVQPNGTGAPRTGTITVNDQTFTVTQTGTCSYAVYPTVRPFTQEAANGRFTVITQGGCAWTAVSNVPWITLTPNFTSGTGTGRVRYSIQPNGTTATRTGTITVNGQTHTVTQTSAGTTPMIQFSGNGEFTINENAASRSATITVTRSGDTTGAATVEYATIDDPAAIPCDPNIKQGDGQSFPQGKAYARCDYATTIDTLTFNIGETTKSFTVPLINDVFQEGNETFQILIRNPQGATLGTVTTALVTLQSDDLATPTTNPINQTPVFVRQQYLDFLDREPEAGEPWTGVLNRCGNIFTGPDVNTDCDRIAVSGAFFGSPEFRLKGFFVFLHYKAAFGSANNPLYVPEYVDFVTDARRVSGVTAEEVIAKRLDFSEDFLERMAVANVFAGATDTQFVDRVLSNLGITLTTADPATGHTRTSLVNGLNAGTLTRAQALRIIVESTEAVAAQFNRAFVAIQYYGYLRRTPEPQGYQNNLNVLNATNNSRQLINGFLNSVEYRLRFGANTANP